MVKKKNYDLALSSSSSAIWLIYRRGYVRTEKKTLPEWFVGICFQEFRHVHPLFDVGRPALALPSPFASVFNDAFHDGPSEPVMSSDVAKLFHLPTLNNDKKRLLSAHETFKFSPYKVISFVLRIGECGGAFRRICSWTSGFFFLSWPVMLKFSHP